MKISGNFSKWKKTPDKMTVINIFGFQTCMKLWFYLFSFTETLSKGIGVHGIAKIPFAIGSKSLCYW